MRQWVLQESVELHDYSFVNVVVRIFAVGIAHHAHNSTFTFKVPDRTTLVVLLPAFLFGHQVVLLCNCIERMVRAVESTYFVTLCNIKEER